MIGYSEEETCALDQNHVDAAVVDTPYDTQSGSIAGVMQPLVTTWHGCYMISFDVEIVLFLPDSSPIP